MSKRLTGPEFESIRKYLVGVLSDRTILVAYGHLVEGRRQADIADAYSISRKSANIAVGKVWAIYQKHRETPEGWQRFEVLLPDAMASVVQQMQTAALQQLEDEKR